MNSSSQASGPRRIGQYRLQGRRCWHATLRVAAVFALAYSGKALASFGTPKAEVPGWVEVQTAHFIVDSNAGEVEARRVAGQFEQIRAVFRGALPKLRVDPGRPLVIVAARDEATMKELTPDEWEGDGRVHPAGLFHSDEEKDYVVLRLDAEGTTAFHTIYHEYTHALLHLNFKQLPTWLSEGLAELFANSLLSDKGVQTGRADKTHLYILSHNQWLPMETLFSVGEHSPYYNEKNPASIFYAESWAVAHYLLLEPEARRAQLLNRFLTAWSQSGDRLAAAKEAFGDLKQFGDAVRKYVQSRDWRLVLAVTPARSEAGDFSARSLSAGEVLAVRSNLLVHRGLTAQALHVAEQAVQAEPGLATAHEALGFAHFRLSEFAAADEEMSKAIQLGSRDNLAFYCHGVLLLRDLGAPEDKTALARAALERAAALNPGYAPTFEALTQAYSRSADTQIKAMAAAQTAVKLDPDSRTYQFGLAYALLNNGRTREAGAVAQSLAASAANDEDRKSAARLLDTVEEEAEWEKENAEAGAGDTAGAAIGSPGAAGNLAHPAISRRTLRPPEWMAVDGAILSMDCSPSPEVTMTLDLPKGPLSFHAVDFRRVGVSGASAETTPGLESCEDWTGRRVKVWFRFVPDKEYLGEIIRVHFE